MHEKREKTGRNRPGLQKDRMIGQACSVGACALACAPFARRAAPKSPAPAAARMGGPASVRKRAAPPGTGRKGDRAGGARRSRRGEDDIRRGKTRGHGQQALGAGRGCRKGRARGASRRPAAGKPCSWVLSTFALPHAPRGRDLTLGGRPQRRSCVASPGGDASRRCCARMPADHLRPWLPAAAACVDTGAASWGTRGEERGSRHTALEANVGASPIPVCVAVSPGALRSCVARPG